MINNMNKDVLEDYIYNVVLIKVRPVACFDDAYNIAMEAAKDIADYVVNGKISYEQKLYRGLVPYEEDYC